MPRWTQGVAGALCVLGIEAVAVPARAQTVTMTGTSVPDRIVGGKDLGPSERPQNLNPTGISYSDCIRNMSLRFSVYLSGFAGQNLQVWATANGTCSNDADRGIGQNPTCWQVAGSLTSLNQAGGSTQIDVRVQDIVGPQGHVPNPAVLIANTYGPSACNAQTTSAPVPMTVWFVPVDGSNHGVGMAYSYPIATDMVGPAAPVGVAAVAGDTLLQISWTPNSDSDTSGYDLYVDPAPGKTTTSTTTVLVCPDSGAEAGATTSPVDAAAQGAADASDDASALAEASLTTEAGTSADSNASSDAPTSMDATSSAGGSSGGGATGGNCYTMQVPASGMCGDAVLSQGIVSDGGAVSTSSSTDDAGGVDGGSTYSAGGGISTIPTANLVNADGLTSITVSSEGVGAYNVSGLTNGIKYTVVVAAVDAFGNIGPPSTQVCGLPAPIKDFFKTYRMDGGQAGGGFCALENVGAAKGIPAVSFGFTALAFGLYRRRSRRNRKAGSLPREAR